MKLKDNVLNEIRKNYTLRREIMTLRNVSEFTLLRWLRDNDEQLLHFPTLEMISNSLNISITDMVIREKVETIHQTQHV